MSEDLTLLLRVSGPFFDAETHAMFSAVNDEISVSAPKNKWVHPSIHYSPGVCYVVQEEHQIIAYRKKQKVAVFQMGVRLRKYFNDYFLRRIE